MSCFHFVCFGMVPSTAVSTPFALGKVTCYPKGYIPPGALPVTDNFDNDNKEREKGNITKNGQVTAREAISDPTQPLKQRPSVFSFFVE
jgi:hypothetical protein